MPPFEPIASAEKRSSVHANLHAKGIGSLVVTVLLCLPSLFGGSALVMNALLYRRMEEWKETSSAIVALGVFFGAPLVSLAAVVGGIISLSGRVSDKIKYAELFVVTLAGIATLSLLFRFGT